jgi:thioredoxin reductase (NADPH)
MAMSAGVVQTDLAIIGAGVAGLTAAAAAAREGVQVLVIERMGAGGQVMTVERVDNFPPHPEGISGFELGPALQEEAEIAGAQFMLDEVEAITQDDSGRHLLRCSGVTIAARAVLIAAGSKRRMLGVPGEEQLEGRGVSHCASCDGPLYRGQAVCVAGGGDSAFGEARVLADHAARVMVVFPQGQPHAQPYLVEALAAMPNVKLVAGATITRIVGDGSGVTGVRIASGGAERVLAVQGVFVCAGLQADTGFLAGALRLDAQGRIETDARMRTSVAGIFAAGDIRSQAAYLLTAAASDGTAAAASACEYLSKVVA